MRKVLTEQAPHRCAERVDIWIITQLLDLDFCASASDVTYLVVCVDPDSARPDGACQAINHVHILGEDARCKAILGRICSLDDLALSSTVNLLLE